jgi:POT family proton-dependent oligopeptide transporter
MPTRRAGYLRRSSGSVKPNASTLMGAIYEKAGKKELLTEAFSLYYAAVNIGSALTTLTLPLVRNAYGYRTALMVPTIFMVIAFVVFAMGKNLYPKEEIGNRPEKTAAERAEERATLTRVAGIFALIVGFWMVYDQYSSTWIFLARDHMNLELWPFGITLAADQIQGFNPIFIICFTPLFLWFWNYLERRTGKPVPATRKMIIGFVLTVFCTCIMSAAGFIAGDGKVSVWYQVIATAVITLSELCISVVGLEFAYSVASDRTKSTVTAAFFVTVFLGNMLGGILDGYYEQFHPGVFFGIQAVALTFCTIAFHFVGRRFEQQSVALAGAGPAASGNAINPVVATTER